MHDDPEDSRPRFQMNKIIVENDHEGPNLLFDGILCISANLDVTHHLLNLYICLSAFPSLALVNQKVGASRHVASPFDRNELH